MNERDRVLREIGLTEAVLESITATPAMLARLRTLHERRALLDSVPAADTSPDQQVQPETQQELKATVEALESLSAEIKPVRTNGRMEPDMSTVEPLVKSQFKVKNGRDPDEAELFNIMSQLKEQILVQAPEMKPGDRLKFELPST